jgi:hypothetical protein
MSLCSFEQGSGSVGEFKGDGKVEREDRMRGGVGIGIAEEADLSRVSWVLHRRR